MRGWAPVIGTNPGAAGDAVAEESGSGSGWAEISAKGVCFYVILDGTADVAVHGEHRVPLSGGDYFGETSLIDGKPRTATVAAGPGGLTVFELPAWEFLPVLEDQPSAAITMLKVLAGRLRTAESRTWRRAADLRFVREVIGP